LPVIIRLAPDYSAPFPLWGEGSAISTGGIPSSRPRCSTGSPPGSRSSTTTTTTRPAGDPPQPGTAGLTTAKGLATGLRAVLGTRTELVVDLWPLDEKT